MGDWIQILHNGGRAWTQYRFKGKTQIMVPSYDKSFWQSLESFDKHVFYRVANGLPPTVELKVRSKPEAGAEIVGCLNKEMIVAVGAKLGCWLQIKYGTYTNICILF